MEVINGHDRGRALRSGWFTRKPEVDSPRDAPLAAKRANLFRDLELVR